VQALRVSIQWSEKNHRPADEDRVSNQRPRGNVYICPGCKVTGEEKTGFAVELSGANIRKFSTRRPHHVSTLWHAVFLEQ